MSYRMQKKCIMCLQVPEPRAAKKLQNQTQSCELCTAWLVVREQLCIAVHVCDHTHGMQVDQGSQSTEPSRVDECDDDYSQPSYYSGNELEDQGEETDAMCDEDFSQEPLPATSMHSFLLLILP